MTNFTYNKGASEICHTDLDWETVSLKVMLLKTSYTPAKTHNYVSDISSDECDVTSYARQALTSNNVVTEDDTNHRTVFDSDTNPTFSSLETGNTIEGCAVFYDTGVDTTAPLIFWVDQASGSPAFPFTTNGSDLTITWAATGIGYIQQ